MSTLVSHDPEGDTNAKYTAVIKGSAEALRARLEIVPEWYEKVHKNLAREGHRVLALASKSGVGKKPSMDRLEFLSHKFISCQNI